MSKEITNYTYQDLLQAAIDSLMKIGQPQLALKLKESFPLYLFEQDNGVDGNIIVVAKDKESAIALMGTQLNYDSRVPIKKYDIINGLLICNLGDS